MCVKGGEGVSVCVCVCVFTKEGEDAFVYMWESERVCVCVYDNMFLFHVCALRMCLYESALYVYTC